MIALDRSMRFTFKREATIMTALLAGHHLEALTKERNRIGKHSIHINDQFRICFI